mmetsp:Transcript_8821/g.21426  ORF Transcript_8821/g.21426 Transcript_8821/m.21426 type:complete len:269 (+) Transcript_8821:1628-2434(+)
MTLALRPIMESSISAGRDPTLCSIETCMSISAGEMATPLVAVSRVSSTSFRSARRSDTSPWHSSGIEAGLASCAQEPPKALREDITEITFARCSPRSPSTPLSSSSLSCSSAAAPLPRLSWTLADVTLSDDAPYASDTATPTSRRSLSSLFPAGSVVLSVSEATVRNVLFTPDPAISRVKKRYERGNASTGTVQPSASSTNVVVSEIPDLGERAMLPPSGGTLVENSISAYPDGTLGSNGVKWTWKRERWPGTKADGLKTRSWLWRDV